MDINADLLLYLEDLSCLTLTDSEKQRLSAELKEILDYMALLGELDMRDIPECSHPFDNVNALREDKTEASFERGLILKNAPESDGGMFISPKTIE
ncbi:MAG: Asp-tRNA(Asn)/Glu-tRNA(Gln) amidotransferase subunit GatC [Oscillospiraceae bacterium]|nr:Asp-tRNA(Asn)/Glu-tRNA(Gln) amidotransferase subunit GatC [Oscillospiraceae bacterium]